MLIAIYINCLKIYTTGSNQPVELLRFIEVIETAAGQKPQVIMKPMQSDDLSETDADVSELIQDVSFSPSTSLETGIVQFLEGSKSHPQNILRLPPCVLDA